MPQRQFKQFTASYLSVCAFGFSLAQWFFLRSTLLLWLSPILLILSIVFTWADYRRYKGH